MRPLVVGVSHHQAPPGLLDRLALSADAAGKLAVDVAAALGGIGVAGVAGEAVVLSTCNRVEVYAAAEEFHATVVTLTALLARHTGVAEEELAARVEVRWGRAARAHAFRVATGLDSVVQGEPQILGQLRAAFRAGQDAGTVGPTLNAVLQQALRLGKQVQAGTRAADAGRSLVSVALDLAPDVRGGAAVVVGAGSIAGLAVAELRRRGVGSLTLVNRTPTHAAAVAAGTAEIRVLALADTAGLHTALVAADLVVSCTGAPGTVLSVGTVASAVDERDGRPLTLLDLARPHDLEPGVATLTGVAVVDLETVAASGRGRALAEDIAAVEALVATELDAVDGTERAASSVPAVVALRALAAGVVEAELTRLRSRTPDLTDVDRAEVERTVQRVVDKLLHRPSVRVRELAGDPVAPDYGEALRQLFALEPGTVAAVTGVPGIGGVRP